ncbi:hypothetical protein [Thioalkalivibrio thiocyanoxidans]|uniref:hypothetical protein n=1 Tax=Thioalkalivibrio thiocyanoxidans TaxID=152475 RepID=UPI001FCC6965|nr:hypothetical protein [Thioalkalivibrio thiocyanoxidans]
MNDTSRLYLHVGTHKTGTTSIQTLMEDRVSLFTEAGVIPLLTPDGKANQYSLAHRFIRPEVRTPMRLRQAKPVVERAVQDKMLDHVRKSIGESRYSSFLLSSEAFSFLREDRERRELEATVLKLVDEVIPILVMREERAWRKSFGGQIRKMGIQAQCAELEEAERPDGVWYYDREALFEFWGRVGPLITIDYDAALRRDGDVIPSFLAAVGIGSARYSERAIWKNLTREPGYPPN